ASTVIELGLRLIPEFFFSFERVSIRRLTWSVQTRENERSRRLENHRCNEVWISAHSSGRSSDPGRPPQFVRHRSMTGSNRSRSSRIPALPPIGSRSVLQLLSIRLERPAPAFFRLQVAVGNP